MTAIPPNSYLPLHIEESAVEIARRMQAKMEKDLKKGREKYKNLSSSEQKEWEKNARDLLQRMN